MLSAIGEDLGPFAERALRARLTTARVFTDKQIDTWAKRQGKRHQGGLNGWCRLKKGLRALFYVFTRLHDTLNNSFCFCEEEIEQDRPVEHPGVKVFYRQLKVSGEPPKPTFDV